MNYQVSYSWSLLKTINHQRLQVTSEGAKTLAIFMSDEKSHLQTINFSLNYIKVHVLVVEVPYNCIITLRTMVLKDYLKPQL